MSNRTNLAVLVAQQTSVSSLSHLLGKLKGWGKRSAGCQDWYGGAQQSSRSAPAPCGQSGRLERPLDGMLRLQCEGLGIDPATYAYKNYKHY